MDIEKLQTKHGFKPATLQIAKDRDDVFFLGPIDKLSLFRDPIFIIFIKIQDEVVEFLTAQYIDNPNCGKQENELINQSTHFYVLNDFDINHEKANRYLSTLTYTHLNEKFKYKIIDPFINQY